MPTYLGAPVSDMPLRLKNSLVLEPFCSAVWLSDETLRRLHCQTCRIRDVWRREDVGNFQAGPRPFQVQKATSTATEVCDLLHQPSDFHANSVMMFAQLRFLVDASSA